MTTVGDALQLRRRDGTSEEVESFGSKGETLEGLVGKVQDVLGDWDNLTRRRWLSQHVGEVSGQ
jgi:hypothetical protein